MTELKLIHLQEERLQRIVRVRHDLGQLLAAACVKRGLNEHDVLQISNQEAKSWIVEELETELPFWPQAIASDVLEETAGRRHRAPDIEEEPLPSGTPGHRETGAPRTDSQSPT